MDQLVLASDSKNFTGVPGPARFAAPDRLADAIIARVAKPIVLGLPLGLGKANHVANALFARAQADRSLKLRIFTALTLEKPRGSSELGARFARPLGHRIFGGYPDLAYAAAQRERRLPPNVQVDEFFFQAGTRLGIASAQQSYISANYTHAIGYVLARGGQRGGANRGQGGTRRRDASEPELQSRYHARSPGSACARQGRFPVGRTGQFRAAFHARRCRSGGGAIRVSARKSADRFSPVRAAARADRPARARDRAQRC